MSTVLIVDDDRILRRLFGKKLTHCGMHVLYATNGVEGLAVCEAESPDLILLDLHMPVMGGIEMLDQLRQIPHYEHIPVIVVTAGILPFDTSQIDQADEVLLKPVTTRDLALTVEEVLQRTTRTDISYRVELS